MTQPAWPPDGPGGPPPDPIRQRSPAASRWPPRRLRRHHALRGARRVPVHHLDRRRGRRRAPPVHAGAPARHRPALVARRPVACLRLRAREEGQGPALRDARGRRGARAAHRPAPRRGEPGLVPGWPVACLRLAGRRLGGARGRGGARALEAAADHRHPPVQVERRGIHLRPAASRSSWSPRPAGRRGSSPPGRSRITIPPGRPTASTWPSRQPVTTSGTRMARPTSSPCAVGGGDARQITRTMGPVSWPAFSADGRTRRVHRARPRASGLPAPPAATRSRPSAAPLSASPSPSTGTASR